ncbi:MAG: hypothetical protein LBU09_01860 [Endomicrobium sp.]|jgi:hypothetical protein|nr:hypothetical protein [Endomicrobium sp.]
MPKFTILFLSLFCLSSCAVLDIPARVAGVSIAKFENEKNGRYEKYLSLGEFSPGEFALKEFASGELSPGESSHEKFALSKKKCFDKSLAILKELRARVTHKSYKKGYIIAFDFSKYFDYCLDSTEVGIFIEELEDKIKISVICNNSLLAKNFSDKYFEMLNAKIQTN